MGEGETLLLQRKPTEAVRRLTLNESWPEYSPVALPGNLSPRQEDIYEERISPDPCP